MTWEFLVKCWEFLKVLGILIYFVYNLLYIIFILLLFIYYLYTSLIRGWESIVGILNIYYIFIYIYSICLTIVSPIETYLQKSTHLYHLLSLSFPVFLYHFIVNILAILLYYITSIGHFFNKITGFQRRLVSAFCKSNLNFFAYRNFIITKQASI